MQRVVVSTYQSASGAGARAMDELKDLSRAVLDGETPKAKCCPIPWPSTSSSTTRRFSPTATAKRK